MWGDATDLRRRWLLICILLAINVHELNPGTDTGCLVSQLANIGWRCGPWTFLEPFCTRRDLLSIHTDLAGRREFDGAGGAVHPKRSSTLRMK